MQLAKPTIALLCTSMIAACGGGSPGSRDDAVDASRDASATDGSIDGAARDAFAMDAPIDGARDGTSGRDAIDAVSSGDGGCHLAVPPIDSRSTQRDACMFAAGDHVADTIDDDATIRAARSAIRTVFVFVQENHSFDNYFGRTAGVEGFPAGYSNTDTDGTVIAAHHLTSSCPCDPGHSRGSMLTAWNMGAMDGFARANSTTYQSNAALGYYTDADHPFYSWLLTTFATSDRFFSSVLDATGPNRRVLWDGTNRDVWSSSPSPSTFPPRPSIFAALDDAHVRWGDYANGTNTLEGVYGQLLGRVPNVYQYSDFVAQAMPDDPSMLPSVIFIDAGSDEHPTQNIHNGERFLHDFFTLLFAHPRIWAHSAVLFTYDEGGGFFDHVPPPPACVPTTNSYDSGYERFGVRVPLYVVSPYTRPHFVSHRTHSHSSVLRFLEMLFDLPALTTRDANADALLDLFDFGCPSFATPPTMVPAAASGSCPSGCAQ
jgi:phospholipase C